VDVVVQRNLEQILILVCIHAVQTGISVTQCRSHQVKIKELDKSHWLAGRRGRQSAERLNVSLRGQFLCGVNRRVGKGSERYGTLGRGQKKKQEIPRSALFCQRMALLSVLAIRLRTQYLSPQRRLCTVCQRIVERFP
jgi:hypothetical protein